MGPHIFQIDSARILAATRRGKAADTANNCLIDSLRQLVNPTSNVRVIREAKLLIDQAGIVSTFPSTIIA